MVLAKLITAVFCIALLSVCAAATEPAGQALTDHERNILAISGEIIRMFGQHPDEIWPGYNLAEMPFAVYVPERWVLLLNNGGEIEGFGPCPDGWPDLGTSTLYHEGRYANLSGQLAFGHTFGPLETVAIGLPARLPSTLENPEIKIFAYIVHEAFHEYQAEAFGEIPWAREERYPIEDRENAALAFLEMRLLVDALEAMKVDDMKRCEELLSRFAAVRTRRWQVADPFVAKYEQGQEIREATAKYVEVKCIELMAERERDSAVPGFAGPLAESFASVSMPDYLISDFGDRMADGYVPPRDLIRNRIYPVGSALGYLLDYLGIAWKEEAQMAGSEFTFAALVLEDLGVEEGMIEGLAGNAADEYDYDAMLTAASRGIDEHTAGYKQALNDLENQGSHRIEISLSSKNLARSRVSTEKKWVVDSGTRTLCTNFQIYSLEKDDLTLQITNTGILEENDWDERLKKVVIYLPELPPIVVDGESFTPTAGTSRSFASIGILGESCKLHYTNRGRITYVDGNVSIELAE